MHKSEVLEKIKKAIDENIWYDEGDNIHIDEDDYMNEIEQIISEYEDGMLGMQYVLLQALSNVCLKLLELGVDDGTASTTYQINRAREELLKKYGSTRFVWGNVINEQ